MLEELAPHITELRKRLFISVLTVIVFFIISFAFWEVILEFMLAPLKSVMQGDSEVIFTHPAEAFFTAMKVSFFTGLVFAMPVIFWQFWLFVAPGLYDNEKKYVIPFVVSASVMFIAGCAFCYYLVVPVAFDFLINFGSGTFTAMPKIGEFVGFFIKLIAAFGISFELPILTFFLALVGLVTDQSLKGFFRYAIVLIFIFAAIMTPPDILSQFMLAVPLIILYSLSILIAKMVNPYKPLDETEQSSDKKDSDKKEVK